MAVMATKFTLGPLALLFGMTHVIGNEVYNPGELLLKIPLLCPLPLKENSSIYEMKGVEDMLDVLFSLFPDYDERHNFSKGGETLIYRYCSTRVHATEFLALECQNVTPGKFCLYTFNETYPCVLKSLIYGTWSHDCYPGFYCEGGASPMRTCMKGAKCGWKSKAPEPCPDGKFCIMPAKPFPCNPDDYAHDQFFQSNSSGDSVGHMLKGTVCTPDEHNLTLLPQACPRGSFCRNGTQHLCPAGKYCTAGSMDPKSCDFGWGVSCPAGAAFPHRSVRAAGEVIVWLIVLAVAVSTMRCWLFQHNEKSLMLRTVAFVVATIVLPVWQIDHNMVGLLKLYAFYAATLWGIVVTPFLRYCMRRFSFPAWAATSLPKIADAIFLLAMCWFAGLWSQFVMILWMIGTLSYQVIVNLSVDLKAKPYMICLGIFVELAAIAFCVVPVPTIGTQFQRVLASNVSILAAILLGSILFPLCYEREGSHQNAAVPLSSVELGDIPVVSVQGVSIELKKVSLTVTKEKKKLYQMPTLKTILHEVSLEIPSGKSLAVMGPSGCGKSSLMNVVSGRAGYGTIKGEIAINGQTGVSAEVLRSQTGFVAQDDMMHKSLTVQDNVQFQAWLRAVDTRNGNATSYSWFNWIDRSKFVEEETAKKLEQLGLKGVKNSVISAISGGQRKRVSIAMELMGNPSLLLLDEPTSGLDSATSETVVNVFAGDYRKTQSTSVAVIHLPAYETLSKFDLVAFLAEGGSKGGRLVYYGATDKAELKKYFNQIPSPAKFDEWVNPADAIMDAITFKAEACDEHRGPGLGTGQVLLEASPHAMEDCEQAKLDWVEKNLVGPWDRFREQGDHSEMPKSLARPLPDMPVSAITWGQELFVHAVRAGKLLQTDMKPIMLNSLCSCGVVVVIVQAMGTQSNPLMEVMQPCVALFALMITQSVIAQRIFGGTERLTSIREASAGLDMICYFVGRDIMALIEIGLGTIIFTGVYWGLGPLLLTHNHTFWATFCFLYAVWGLAYIWSILLEPTQALMLSIISTFACWLLSGVLIPFSTIVQIPFAPYIMAFSPIRWAHGYLMFKHTSQSNQFRSPLILLSLNSTLNSYGIPVDAITSSSWQEDYPYIVDRWQTGKICFVTDITQLIMLGILYRVLAGIALMHRTQREANGGALFSDAKGPARRTYYLLVVFALLAAPSEIIVMMRNTS